MQEVTGEGIAIFGLVVWLIYIVWALVTPEKKE